MVNGLWRYDLAENKIRLQQDKRLLSEARIEELSTRYLVRVGMRRSNLNPRIAEYVVLPEGWRFSPVDIVNDGRTVNVGDIVTLKVASPRMVDYLTGIERKCDSTPDASERPEWQIGCTAVTAFGDKSGYGGKHYYWTGF